MDLPFLNSRVLQILWGFLLGGSNLLIFEITPSCYHPWLQYTNWGRPWGATLPLYAKPWEKFWRCIWQACYIFMNSPLRKEEGSYIYSLRVGGRELMPTCRHHKLLGISWLPFLRSRCRNPPSPKPHDLQLSSFMIRFASCFTMGKDHGCRTFVKLQGQTWPPHHRHLILGMPRPWDFTIHLKHKSNWCVMLL